MTTATTRSTIAVWVGLALTIAGFVLISALGGGVLEIQRAEHPWQFGFTAAVYGNNLRLASWVDILVFVPGYALLIGGLLVKLRAGLTGPKAQISALGIAALAASVVFDQIENALVQLGLGTVVLIVLGLSAVRFAPDSGPSRRSRLGRSGGRLLGLFANTGGAFVPLSRSFG